MTFVKTTLSRCLRKARLLFFADYLRYLFLKWINSRHNREFIDKNPGLAMPPDYLMYESFKLDYSRYYFGGKETADWIYQLTKDQLPGNHRVLLDWGCGPGRVIRHWGEKGFQCFGSDINKNALNWCRKYLKEVHFLNQDVLPPLEVERHSFDLIYGISILTHLSEVAHRRWVEEFNRILKPGGILFLTTQGDAFKHKLTKKEKNDFERGNLIVRASVREGHRIFSSFQPKTFMEQLFHSFEILNHISAQAECNVQDVWIVKKIIN